MEGKIPDAPFSEGQRVWQRSCTQDMGLERIERAIAEISYIKGEWRIRFDRRSLESYPACYFQSEQPAEQPDTGPYIRKVPRHVARSK